LTDPFNDRAIKVGCMTRIDLNTVSIPLRWEELYPQTAAINVEIGSGKGRFLIEISQAQTDRNFLAVERAAKYYELSSLRVAKRGLQNVRTLRTTAEDLLYRLLPPSSVDTFYVLFPDPWPKKRHHKRRFFTPDNLNALCHKLTPGGRLLVKSDHLGYSEVIAEAIAGCAGLVGIDAAAAFAGLPLSGFEVKYRDQGREIRSFAACKTEMPPNTR